MSVTSAAHKKTSKIYLDLKRAKVYGPITPVDINFERLRTLSIMDRVLKVRSESF